MEESIPISERAGVDGMHLPFYYSRCELVSCELLSRLKTWPSILTQEKKKRETTP